MHFIWQCRWDAGVIDKSLIDMVQMKKCTVNATYNIWNKNVKFNKKVLKLFENVPINI